MKRLLALSLLISLGQPVIAAAATYADLAPVLGTRCTLCHAGSDAAAGLRLDSLEGVLAGSAKGRIVKAGDPAGSELIRRLKGTSQPRMPMTGPPFLSEAEIARFEQWIAAGLPAGKTVAAPVAVPPLPATAESVTYANVAPILAKACAKCHTEKGLMGAAPEGYRLTSLADTLSAADRVRVVPGQPAASELVRRIKGQARPRMPLDGPPWLSEQETRLIETWIAQGAPDAEGRPADIPTGARVRLHGVLAQDGTLDGLELHAVPAGRADKRARPGDYVRLDGRVDAQGKLEVERLRRR